MATGMRGEVKRRKTSLFHDILENPSKIVPICWLYTILEAKYRTTSVRKRNAGFPAKSNPFPAVCFQCQECGIIQWNIPVTAAFARMDIDLFLVTKKIAKS